MPTLSSNIPAEDHDTIQRCPHDKENPYSMVSRDLIRDESISPECRWLIIYLLSMKDGWKINISQIKEHVKPFMGRDRVYKMLNEAIESGYMKREEYKEIIRKPDGSYKGAFKRVRYFISETPKFKKCYLHTGFQDPENPHAKERTCEDIPIVLSCVAPPPVGAPPLEKPEKNDLVVVEKQICSGGVVTISKQDLFTAATQHQLDWTEEEIHELWDILAKYQKPMRDWLKFCVGTINNLRKIRKIKNLKESECQNKSPLNKKSRPTTAESPKKTETKSCSGSNTSTSEQDIRTPVLANLLSEFRKKKNWQDFSKPPQTS